MGGALPPALLCAALGVALSFAAWRSVIVGLALVTVSAVAGAFAPLPESWRELVLVGCWLTVAAVAALVHLPSGVGLPLASVAALLAGGFAGAAVAAAGAPLDLSIALPCALLCLPGRWLVVRGRGIVVKVLSSWLIAVAVLAAALSLAVPTAGYEPDHME